MIETADIALLRAWRRERRAEGSRVAFVPTMGFLHEGHLSLVDAARRRADVVVMSVFVNPLQFAPTDDLDRYPRDIVRDRALAERRGVDLLFVPEAATMYPPGAGTRVVPGAVADRWEGAARPGHFAGVLTIVAKLFHLVEPDVACFGQKDIQQATVVRAMVRDLDWRLEIEVVPTVREPDGLALSSRNVYLSPDERRDALGLSDALRAVETAFRAGERSAGALERVARTRLELYAGVRDEYIAIVEPAGLAPVDRAEAGTIVAIAARVGATRLIDNVILRED